MIDFDPTERIICIDFIYKTITMISPIETKSHNIFILDAISYTNDPMTNIMGGIMTNFDFVVEYSRL